MLFWDLVGDDLADCFDGDVSFAVSAGLSFRDCDRLFKAALTASKARLSLSLGLSSGFSSKSGATSAPLRKVLPFGALDFGATASVPGFRPVLDLGFSFPLHIGLLAMVGFNSCCKFAMVEAVQVVGDAMAAMTLLVSNANRAAMAMRYCVDGGAPHVYVLEMILCSGSKHIDGMKLLEVGSNVYKGANQ